MALHLVFLILGTALLVAGAVERNLVAALAGLALIVVAVGWVG